MKTCFRCKKPIEKKDNYFIFSEIKDEKEISKEYTHKYCWDEFLKKLSDTNEAMGIVRSLKKKLVSVGFLPNEEYIIKWIKEIKWIKRV